MNPPSPTAEAPYSFPVNDIGHPTIPEAAQKIVIKTKGNTLCRFWRHEYVLNEKCIVNKNDVPMYQMWNCCKCGKTKFTEISRP